MIIEILKNKKSRCGLDAALLVSSELSSMLLPSLLADSDLMDCIS
jgi:hypothetical protein